MAHDMSNQVHVPNGGAPDTKHSLFAHFSTQTARLAGRPTTFALACALVIAWLATGPLFGFSENWQLVINTGTTIVTFLMVFIIQDSQNRDTAALHLKLDELIRATKAAKNELIDLEDLSQEELDHLREQYARVAHERDGEPSRFQRSIHAEHKRRLKRSKRPQVESAPQSAPPVVQGP